MRAEVKEKTKYAVVAAVQLPGVSDVEFDASLVELRDLAKTLGFKVTRTFTQKRSAFDSAAYLGIGKREEIRCFVNEPRPLTIMLATSTSSSSTTKSHRRRRATSK